MKLPCIRLDVTSERKGVLNIYFRKVLISKISHPSPLKEKEEEEDTAEEEEEAVAAVTVP